jgi:D-lyxose ketol-isomerase
MKRSTVNKAIRDAKAFFTKHHWALPPDPKWDVTDFGLGNFDQYGLVLVNLAEEKEYCEKLMYARKGMKTPFHFHRKKKEDIIVRNGMMAIKITDTNNGPAEHKTGIKIQVNGRFTTVNSGDILMLSSGERITLAPGVIHEFWPESDECIIGEVSTANDDLNDNFFINPDVGRFSEMEEDEPAAVKLVSD